MKKYLVLSLFIIAGFFFSSCDDTTTEPAAQKGAIYIISIPAGAQIWLDGQNQSKVTPDSLTGLDAGSYQVTLKMTGYRDTTVTVSVSAGTVTPKTVVLTSTVSLTTYGPVQIWESADPSTSHPSGIDLSAGVAIAISGTDKQNADAYYTSDVFKVITASYANALTRKTYFKAGTSTDLNDGVSSPVKDGTWTDRMPDDFNAVYYFLYDADGHYSKFKIESRNGGTPGNPSTLMVKWIYNKTKDDVRFQ